MLVFRFSGLQLGFVVYRFGLLISIGFGCLLVLACWCLVFGTELLKMLCSGCLADLFDAVIACFVLIWLMFCDMGCLTVLCYGLGLGVAYAICCCYCLRVNSVV